MDLRDRFLEGVDFMEEHLLEPVRLADAAARAGVSPTHFSRLFRVLTGETFGCYLRRRRLTLAAQRLLDESPGSLIELAFDCQYDSQEAFTRAFKRAFGVTPGAYRRCGGPSRVQWRDRLDAARLERRKETLTMEPEIREIDSFQLVGVRERFDQESKTGIPGLWQRLMPLIPKIPHLSEPARSFGACLNTDLQTGSFDYIAGVGVDRIDRLPDGLVAETIPRQTYACFTHTIQGEDLHAELQPTMAWILGTWLPASKHTMANGPDLEVYPPGFEPGPGHSLEVCIPIAAA